LDEQRRLRSAIKEILPKLKASSQSLGKTMEDVRLMLGLSQEEIVYLLSLLEKTDFGSLHYTRGNTDIRFLSLPGGNSKYCEITLVVEVKDGDITNTIKYILPRDIIRSAKKKSLGVNDGAKEQDKA